MSLIDETRNMVEETSNTLTSLYTTNMNHFYSLYTPNQCVKVKSSTNFQLSINKISTTTGSVFVCQMVRFSWMAMNDPTMFPPTSGNASLPGNGRTLPFRSTSTGYFNRCPLMSETSSAANCSQFLSPIVLTFLTHSILSGCVKQSSNVAICSAHSDILYPYICTQKRTSQ